MTKQRLPAGWSEKKVQRVLKHYENQTEAAAVAEDEAAFDSAATVMKIPRALVPEVRRLIAKRRKSSAA